MICVARGLLLRCSRLQWPLREVAVAQARRQLSADLLQHFVRSAAPIFEVEDDVI